MRNAVIRLICMSLFVCENFANAESCHEVLTSAPPFYLSTVSENQVDQFDLKTGQTVNVQGRGENGKIDAADLSLEKFHEELADSARFRFLGRGSRVKLIDPADSSMLETNQLLRVEVIEVEKKYSPHAAGTPAEKGNQGYLPGKSLVSVSDKMSFILNKDFALALFPGLQAGNLAAGTILRPEMSGGKYRALSCPPSLSLSYLFDQYDPKTRKDGHPVALDAGASCLEMSPVKNEFLDDLLAIQSFSRQNYESNEISLNQLEVNDWGFVRIPMSASSDIAGIAGEAPDFSFVKFKGAEDPNTSIWAKPNAVCAFMRLATDWRKECGSAAQLDRSARCTIQLGDAAFFTPGLAENSEHDPLGHKFHYSGECFDIRALRKDEAFDRMNLEKDQAVYDSAATRKLIAFLIGHGATPVYFNDPDIYMDPKLGNGSDACNMEDSFKDLGKKPMPCPGHSNHIHFCLDPSRVAGC
jgi:hypothetical protein